MSKEYKIQDKISQHTYNGHTLRVTVITDVKSSSASSSCISRQRETIEIEHFLYSHEEVYE